MRPIGFFARFMMVLAGPLLVSGCECYGVICDVCPETGIGVQVVDAATKEPILDATVTANGTACPLSNGSGPGVYLCKVSPGSYTIDVAAPGHAAQQSKVTLAEPDGESCCSCGPNAGTRAELAVQ